MYEVAIIDGASRGIVFTQVIVPLIKPVQPYLAVTGTINTFQVFESTYVMTHGDPQFATITVAYPIYQTVFQQFQIGLDSAQAIVPFVLTFALATVQFRWLGRHVEY